MTHRTEVQAIIDRLDDAREGRGNLSLFNELADVRTMLVKLRDVPLEDCH